MKTLMMILMIAMVAMVTSCEKDDSIIPNDPNDTTNVTGNVTVVITFVVPQGLTVKGWRIKLQNPAILDNYGIPIVLIAENLNTSNNTATLTMSGENLKKFYKVPITVMTWVPARDGNNVYNEGSIIMENQTIITNPTEYKNVELNWTHAN